MAKAGPFELQRQFAHLRADATASVLEVNETFWQELSQGRFGNFKDEYLVTTLAFDKDWPVWEMHPQGDEVVVLMSGALDIVLEKKTGNTVISMSGSANWAIVPKGVWHTARVHESSVVLFITPGEGTLQRPIDLL